MPSKAKALLTRYLSRASKASTVRSEADAARGVSTTSDGSGASSFSGGQERDHLDMSGLVSEVSSLGAASHAFELSPNPTRARNSFGFVLALGLTLLTWFVLQGTAADASDNLPGQGFLPDNRAWEMVSPQDKNGSGAMPNTTRTRAAAGGDAVTWAALTAFADANGTGTNGTEYISERTDEGWTTHGITPSQYPPLLPAFKSSTYVGEFSSDLSKAVFLGLSPVVEGHPNVENGANLYLREDLRNPDGPFTLLSDSESPVPADEPFSQLPDLMLAGASTDYTTIGIESKDNLTSDASGSNIKAYAWTQDAPGTGTELIGILPDGTPASSSQIGGGALYNDPVYTDDARDAVSNDGSRIAFTAPLVGISSGDGWEGGPRAAGQLYVRLDGESTIHVSKSERTDCAADPSCGGDGIPDPLPDPAGQFPAAFFTANSDLSTIYFGSREQLTDSDTDDEFDLYVWSENGADGEQLVELLPSTSDSDAVSVMWASDDGTRVYFAADNPDLAPGAPPISNGDEKYVYLRDGDEIHYVGVTSRAYDDTNNSTSGTFHPYRLTDDGRYLLFTSTHPAMGASLGFDTDNRGACNFTAGTLPGACQELFRYDAELDSTVCVSCRGDGELPTDDTTISVYEVESGPTTRRTSHLNTALLADGTVLFSSPDPLLSADANNRVDAYMYDGVSGDISLISSGQAATDSYFTDASADGTDIFFTTKERLVASDIDGDADLYDARVDGGIPAQNERPSQGCVGDACQDNPATAPTSDDPGSSTHEGAGNIDRPDCSARQQKSKKLRAKSKKLRAKVRQAERKQAKQLRKRLRKTQRKVKSARRSLNRCKRGVS